MNDSLPIAVCPLCQASEHTPWLDALGFELVRCSGCGHRYATSVHSPAILANAYYDEPDAAIAHPARATPGSRPIA